MSLMKVRIGKRKRRKIMSGLEITVIVLVSISALIALISLCAVATNNKRTVEEISNSADMMGSDKEREYASVFKVTFPDKPQPCKIGSKDYMGHYSYDAKKVADRYREIVRNGLIKATKEFKNDYSFETHMSLAGLACEIYLKSLLFLENDFEADKRKEHSLASLFNMISEVMQEKIVSTFNKCRGSLCFEEEIRRHAKVFAYVRYPYELNGYRMNSSFMISLMDTLKKVTDESIGEV